MLRNSSFSSLSLCVLVSIGQHPSSARARRAPSDARAVEMGLKLAPGELQVLHVGDSSEPALQSYAGMGLDALQVIEQSAQGDVLDSLLHYFSADLPEIILTGVCAERGESSGMLPYLLGEALGVTVVSGITDVLGIDSGVAEVLQAQPRGQRRKLKVPLPFVASVDMAAPAPRQSAFAIGSRARIEVDKLNATLVDSEALEWQCSPARARPKRLKVVKAKSAAERFKAATQKPASQGGQVLRDLPAREMAQAVFDLLLAEGVLR